MKNNIKIFRGEFDEHIKLQLAPGIVVMDEPASNTYPMPITCTRKDPVYVGRIRIDTSSDNGLTFWVVGDQIKKGAALNAVQIGQYLISHRGFQKTRIGVTRSY